MIRLDGEALFFNDALVRIGKGLREETLPLAVSKGIVIQKSVSCRLRLANQTALVMNGKVLIPLRGQQPDELFSKPLRSESCQSVSFPAYTQRLRCSHCLRQQCCNSSFVSPDAFQKLHLLHGKLYLLIKLV